MNAGAAILGLLLPLLAIAQSGSPVEGQVLDSITQNGIAGIKVTVSSSRIQLSYEIYTDGEGRFYFPLVAPGDYAISFEARGYLPLPPGDPALRVFHVADMADPVQFQEQLTPYGSISGRVFDGEGHPAPGVQIEMLRPRGNGVSINGTDGEGRFTVPNLRPGSYILLARPMMPGSGGDEHKRSVLKPPPGPESEHLTWAATYYPGATDRGSAQAIAVRAGANLTTYDVHLRAAETWRVRGVAIDDLGKPVGGADLMLHSSEPLTGPEARAQTAADGSFEFPNVCPGEWRILAEVQRAKVLWKGSAPVSVAHADVDGVNLRVSAPFTVEAVVDREGTHDLLGERSGATVSLTPADASREHMVAGTYHGDGHIRFESVYAGRYRIIAGGTVAGYYVDSIRLGITDVTGQPVDLAPGCPPIRITYRAGAARVVGLVDNAPGVIVVLAPKNDALLAAQFTRSAGTGLDGRFDIGGLRPGDYYIWAFDHADMTAFADPDFVRSLVALAETVHVEQGLVEVAPNLKVTPWPD